MDFNETTLFEGVQVKRGDEDGPVIGEVLIYEQDGRIAVSIPAWAAPNTRIHHTKPDGTAGTVITDFSY